MAHKVIILYRLFYMPYYFLGTFTEYPEVNTKRRFASYYLLPHRWWCHLPAMCALPLPANTCVAFRILFA